VLILAGSSFAYPRFRNDSDPFLITGYAALGVSSNSPYVFGQFGIRLSERHLFFGIQLSTLLQAGFAADALLYFVKVKRFAIHLVDPGVGWSPFGHYISVPYVRRNLDLRLGVGFELRVCRHAYATFDWKVSFPNPGYVITSYGDYGKSIFIDALKESQWWFGVLIH